MIPAGRLTTAPPAGPPQSRVQNRKSAQVKMKVQDNKFRSTGSGDTAAGQIQKTILPNVRYHPTILTQGHGDGGGAKATSQAQKTTPTVIHRPQTGPKKRDKVHQDNHDADNSKTRVNPRMTLQKPQDRAPLRPEEVPLGLGVMLARRDVEEVELLTRGQRENPAWFGWRQNRITASTAHRIAHSRFVSGTSRTPPASYLAAITGAGPSVQTRAMRWGVVMEAHAVQTYQVLKSRALGRAVVVRDCGLFIDAERPWLAASPDGIVTDSQTGQWLLEVKCPFKHRQRKVVEACRDDPAFCLELQKEEEESRQPVYHLKLGHSYYTQIQCQLAVSGLQQADLVVFTQKETAIVPVTFDPEFWEETVAKLEVFYRDAVLPRLRQTTPRDVPGAMPEL